ncbi:MAG: energy transducer TonB [Candidatus Omnitrophica bacterium]|nr:energy transducer TonB [Candidatus Omnitrophota bacterium]
MEYKVLVDVFEDARPAGERSGTGNRKGFIYTNDKMFRDNVDVQISKMLAEHLRKARVFTSVEFRDINLEDAAMLNKDGVELVIDGDIRHFYGFQKGAAGASVLFGMVGVLAEAMANPKTVGADVEYGNIRVIDVAGRRILWEGNVRHSFEDKDVFYDGPAAYAVRALKEANNKFVQELRIPLGRSGYEKMQTVEPISTVGSTLTPTIVTYMDYYKILHDMIGKALVKPLDSGSGVVNAAFTLSSDGDLVDVEILNGSTDDVALRGAVVTAIEKSAPFPAFPADITEASKRFTISIEFK